MANVQIDSMTDTWNAGGTTFNAIKMNVTDTASAAASKLIDLQVGGNTKANVTKAGLLTLASGVTLTGANTLQTTTGALTLVSGSSNIVLTPSSNVGIGTTGPDKKLDVLDASAAQLRLTHTDGSVYTDFQTLSTGHQLMITSGGNRITSTTVNDTSVLARQVQGGLAFDGVSSGHYVQSDLGAIGTNDFSWSLTFLCPTVTTGSPYIATLGSSATSASGYSFIAYFSGTSLVFQLWGATSGDFRSAALVGFVDTFGGKNVSVVVVRNAGASSLTVYVNSAAATTVESTYGAFPSWSGSVNSVCHTLGNYRNSGTNPLVSTLLSATLFNRALSASEVITLSNQGVQEADKWGNLTGQTSGTLTRGKRYRITTFVAGDSFTNVGAGSNATGVEFVATGTTPTTWTNASTLNQIGSILDADLSAGVGYQVPDRSSNKYHGVVSATGTSWTLAQRRGQLRVSTTASGNNQLLGAQVCLPTNAIITSIVGYTTGTPTVYVGNVSNGSQLVASVAMSASTYTSFTLAAITSTTGNVWVNSSTADTINWTITYMIADP